MASIPNRWIATMTQELEPQPRGTLVGRAVRMVCGFRAMVNARIGAS